MGLIVFSRQEMKGIPLQLFNMWLLITPDKFMICAYWNPIQSQFVCKMRRIFQQDIFSSRRLKCTIFLTRILQIVKCAYTTKVTACWLLHTVRKWPRIVQTFLPKMPTASVVVDMCTLPFRCSLKRPCSDCYSVAKTRLDRFRSKPASLPNARFAI